MKSRTLNDYLRLSYKAGIIDHSLRVSSDDKGNLSFYIHPDGKDGETADFVLIGNRLELPRKTVAEIEADPEWRCPWCEERLTRAQDPRMNAKWFYCTSVNCGFEARAVSMSKPSALPSGMLAPEARCAEEENPHLRG